MGNVRNHRNIQHLQPRVAQGFGKQQFGVVLNRRFELLGLAWIHEGGFDTETRQCVAEQVVGAAIEAA